MIGAWGKVGQLAFTWLDIYTDQSEKEGSDGFQLAWEMFIVQEENYCRSTPEH